MSCQALSALCRCGWMAVTVLGDLVRDVETELMLTWTSLWGLLQFDVNRKAEEASHLCPAACFYQAHHPEIDPKPDVWTKMMHASTYIHSCCGSNPEGSDHSLQGPIC